MRGFVLIIAGAAALVSVNAAAEQVTCASKDKKRKECPMNTQGEVRIVRQISNTACTSGVNWGVSKHAVWVEGGCRAVFESAGAAAASAPAKGIPLINATCPGGLDVHADQGGPVYVNGKEARLKRVNDNYFEARDAATDTTISINRNPDGTLGMSYTGKHGANGICTIR